MYTRCSECETLFRVTREQLNAARGQVRCGRCGNVFDALSSLHEEIVLPGATESRREDRDQRVAPTESRREGAAPTSAPPTAPFLLLTDQRRRRWPWALLAGLALLALAAQMVHARRADLAVHPLVGPYVSGTYEWLRVPLEARVPYDLNAFALLHHELVNDPRRSGALHLSGVLSNEADFAQPWPVLELKLEDRFGDIVAARRLQPDEYLRNPPAGDELMPAHARRAIEIAFLDPGIDAVGFRIDFCASSPAGLHCGAQTFPTK